ncbi:PEP-CTERM sorting domain-containing protein [Kiritimatiellota bacterium B12222]|nr:PEP-CTERM sorting domain-containing protein [Kiritimatiellota bacterium B12222]
MRCYKFFTLLLCSTILGTLNAAVVVEGTPGVSGNLATVDGNEAGSFNYANPVSGEFLVVTLAGQAAGNTVNNNYNSANISVTYNNVALTLGTFGTNSNDGFAGVWYLSDPIADGSAYSLDVSFTPGIFSGEAASGSWQFGAISLSNVNEADPFASVVSAGASVTDQDFSISPDGGQTINAGDFLVLTDTIQAVSLGGNHFETATDGQTDLYHFEDGNGYSSIYQVLTSSDILGGDVPMTDVNNGNKYLAQGLVINAIPEPSSFALILLSMFAVVAFRRK